MRSFIVVRQRMEILSEAKDLAKRRILQAEASKTLHFVQGDINTDGLVFTQSDGSLASRQLENLPANRRDDPPRTELIPLKEEPAREQEG